MSATIIPFPVPQRPASDWRVDGEDARPISPARSELNRRIAERCSERSGTRHIPGSASMERLEAMVKEDISARREAFNAACRERYQQQAEQDD